LTSRISVTVSASSIKVGLGVAAGEDDRDHASFLADDLGGFFEQEHLVADGVVDLVKDNEIPVAGEGRRIIFISRRTVYHVSDHSDRGVRQVW